jgi:hypothetical protein
MTKQTTPFDVHATLRWINENIEDASDGPYYPWWDGGYRTEDPARVIDLGSGMCSDKVAVLTTMALEHGVNARTIGLSGHVVAELELEPNLWRVVDAQYGIVLPASYEELTDPEQKPYLLFQGYANYNPQMPLRYLTTSDNTVHSSALINAERAAVESAQVDAFHDMVFQTLGIAVVSVMILAVALLARARRARTGRGDEAATDIAGQNH